MGKNFPPIAEVIFKVKNVFNRGKKFRIDNFVFSLHKYTAGILFTLSLIVSTNFYLLNPISCISDATVQRVIDAYCWIHATYTLPEKLNADKSFASVAHPGVASHDFYAETENTLVHTYYQWVWIVLFFQAIAFYTPRYIWNHWEEGRVKALSQNLDEFSKDEETTMKRKNDCLKYFHETLGKNDGYSMKYALCEVLNFINVCIQIDITDRFLGRALSTYGFSLISFHRQDPMFRTDPLAIVFPTVTKCTFPLIGPSGNIINYDALCVLQLNIYNEKFYPLLWFWFILLAVISGLALVYRFITYLFPEIRFKLLSRKFRVPDQSLDAIHELNRRCHYGDWFTLYLIGKNMSNRLFMEFLNDLAELVGDSNNIGQTIKQKYL